MFEIETQLFIVKLMKPSKVNYNRIKNFDENRVKETF